MRRVVSDNGRKIGMLVAGQQLHTVQVRDSVFAVEPSMDFGAGDAGAEDEGEAVVGAALGDIGIYRCEME